MGFKSIIFAILIVALFTIAIINFNTTFIELNGGNISLKDDPAINATFNSLINPLSNISSVYNNQSDILAGSSETSAFTVIPSAISGVWTVIINIPNLVFNVYFNLIYQQLLGGDPDFNIFLGVVTAMLGIAVLLWAAHNLRTAEP